MGQVIAFVPVTELYKLPNIPSDNGLLPYYHQLCAIFIDNVEKAPEGLGQISYVIPEGNNVKFSWENTTQYFKFPPKVKFEKEKKTHTYLFCISFNTLKKMRDLSSMGTQKMLCCFQK